ncbi:MAG: urease accessory protein [Paracoccaceae bacterium]|jgi:urease accessory protein
MGIFGHAKVSRRSYSALQHGNHEGRAEMDSLRTQPLGQDAPDAVKDAPQTPKTNHIATFPAAGRGGTGRESRPCAQPRAIGEAMVGAKAARGISVLADLRQRGCAKALLPITPDPGLSAVLLNTAGGITGGDRLTYGGHARIGARLTLTTQAAERAYRAQPGEIGRVDAALHIDAGGRIDWLPQETILFDGCALSRTLTADLAEDASLLAVEAVIFGRAAMGEVLTETYFSDAWRIRRAGRLIYADGFRLIGPAALSRPGALKGAGAVASVLLAAPGAETLKARALTALGDAPDAGLSAFDDMISVRIIAPDGMALRRRLIPLLTLLRGAPLPKVWTL